MKKPLYALVALTGNILIAVGASSFIRTQYESNPHLYKMIKVRNLPFYGSSGDFNYWGVTDEETNETYRLPLSVIGENYTIPELYKIMNEIFK